MKFELLFGLGMIFVAISGFFLANSFLALTGLSVAEIEKESASPLMFFGMGLFVVLLAIVSFVIGGKFEKKNILEKKSIVKK